MATEYVLYASADLSTEEFRTFMVQVVGGEVLGNFVRRDALDVTPYREDLDDPSPIAAMLGFPHRVTATFRLANLASPEARDEAIRLMYRSVLVFFYHYPADGVLLFNGERVVLQKLHGTIVIDSEWDDWADVPELPQMVQGLDSRVLPQPLL